MEKDYISGALHPGDLKPSVVKYINLLLEPVREHFKNDEYARNLLQQVLILNEQEAARKEAEKKHPPPKAE